MTRIPQLIRRYVDEWIVEELEQRSVHTDLASLPLLFTWYNVNMACSQDEYFIDPIDHDILSFDFETFYRYLEDEAVTEEDIEKICEEVTLVYNDIL